MKIEIRSESILIDGYVNAVARDSKPITGKFGKKFIEQIVPGAFDRALKRNSNVRMLLNHDKDRDLGGTDSNLKLSEDSIGLRAIAEITDVEVVKAAKEGKLRGWSFGFCERKASEEETPTGVSRRFVEEMDLLEVSIIDMRKNPCYAGTSIEMRADGEEQVIESRALETEIVVSEEQVVIDNSKYTKRLESLGGK